MTEVGFHFNVPDRSDYACRLTRKALRQGRRLVLTGPLDALAAIDRLLWSMDPVEFLPHLLLRRGAEVAPRLRRTPVWLAERALDAPHHEVLVNVGPQMPEGFESFARLVEIVSVDDDERLAARARWKHYKDRGYAIERHEVGA